MKALLLLITISIFHRALAQEGTDSLYKKAGSLIECANSHLLNSQQKVELKRLGLAIQNNAFVLQEHYNKYSLALDKVNETLEIWNVLKDSSNEANTLKYRGYLLGRLHRFSEAKKDINQAIQLFRSQHWDPGVAVSQLDMARVYDLQAKYDSALYYGNQAKRFWLFKQDTFRIVTVNNELIYSHYRKHDLKEALAVQKESDKLIQKGNVHWQPLIDFYYLSEKLYGDLGSRNEFQKYDAVLRQKLALLKSQNIKPLVSYN